jgi:hypothetical protein
MHRDKCRVEKILDNLKKESIELNDNGCHVTIEVELPDGSFFVVTPFNISEDKLIQCPKCKNYARVDFKYCVFCGLMLTPNN